MSIYKESLFKHMLTERDINDIDIAFYKNEEGKIVCAGHIEEKNGTVIKINAPITVGGAKIDHSLILEPSRREDDTVIHMYAKIEKNINEDGIDIIKLPKKMTKEEIEKILGYSIEITD